MNSLFASREKYRDADVDAALLPEEHEAATTHRQTSKPALTLSFILSLLLNVFLFLLLLGLTVTSGPVRTIDLFQQTYTPVDVIEYVNVNFNNPEPGIEDDWAGPPTPERNARWSELYEVGRTRLSKDQAARLHNKTVTAEPGVDEDYPVIFNVFHDLHCLDSLRLMLGYLRGDDRWNTTHNPYTLPWPAGFDDGAYSVGHAHHCFNSIRQSLQCAADVTPVVFQYRADIDIVVNSFDVMHTCRNFDAIREWAIRNTHRGNFDKYGWRDQQGLCGQDGCSQDGKF